MIEALFKEISELIKAIVREGMEWLIAAFRNPGGWLLLFGLLTAASMMVAPFLQAGTASNAEFQAWMIAHHFAYADGTTTTGSVMFGTLLWFVSMWWLWLFFIMLPIFRDLWLHWMHESSRSKSKWALIELKIPRIVAETPQAMESVLVSMHNLGGGPDNFKERYIEGGITKWMNLEIISIGGNVRFFVRCPKGVKDEVEAAFFAYYPDVDVLIPEKDYMDDIPKSMVDVYSEGKDVWGGDMKLSKSEMYPLKTYHDFETDDPEKAIDPISSLIEAMGKIKSDEFCAVHFLCVPAGKSWHEKFKDEVTKLRTGDAKPDKEGKMPPPRFLSPGETQLLKAIEIHLTKLCFDTTIRMFHVGPPDGSMAQYFRRAVTGYFNQFALLNQNAIGPVGGMGVRVVPHEFPYFFLKTRLEYRKQRILHVFRKRDVPVTTYWGKWFQTYLWNSGFHMTSSKFTTEELATLWHPPTEFVLTSPHIERAESKKAGPPAGLAIFGDEAEIERFYGK